MANHAYRSISRARGPRQAPDFNATDLPIWCIIPTNAAQFITQLRPPRFVGRFTDLAWVSVEAGGV